MPATTSKGLWLGVAVVTASLTLYARAGPAPAEGSPAPALAGRSFSGDPYDLSAWRGKVVVLNFWASWCGPCRSEMPLLDALQRDYRERGVVVLGLSADDRHDRKEALAASQGVAYMTGMLTDCSSNGFGTPQVLPLTYIIDRAGKLSAVLRANRGALSAGQLRAAVGHALDDAAPTVAN